MTESNLGESINSCFEYISRCGREVENLLDVLKNQFNHELERAGRLSFVSAGKPIDSGRLDESGWLYSDSAYSLPLKKRGPGSHSIKSYLTIHACLHGDALLPDSKEPTLHVYCWDIACDFDSDGCYMSFPLLDVVETPDDITIEGERCLRWRSKGGYGDEPWMGHWCFSIQLTALANPTDLKRLVIKPCLDLLKGKPSIEALPDELFDIGLFRYPDHGALFNERT